MTRQEKTRSGMGSANQPGSARRGQVWSFDFMASVTIFFLILVVLFFVWEYTAFQNTDQMIFNDMENRALRTVDTIIRVRGR